MTQKYILLGAFLTSTLTLSACQQTPDYQVVYPLPDSSSSSDSHPGTSAASSLYISSASSASSASSELALSNSEGSSPSSVLIRVPFATQAPLVNWDALHEEACEEASLILVARYLNGQSITLQEMENEIQKLVAWETDHGYKWDVTAEELKDIAQQFYGLDGTVITDVTSTTIKRQIASGHPVIIPAAGQKLGNPYYSGKGPPYHMLVIVGYDEGGFITNDVGTKRGEGYRYDEPTLLNAIHDWNGSNENIEGGKKAILVLHK